MSKVMHAPGPWIARHEPDDGGEYSITAANGIHVALTIGNTSSEAANARLIAAAPDLLEALQALFANMLAQDLENEAKRPTEGEFLACMAAANSAIDKATGGQA